MISEGIASGFSRGKVEVCKQVGNFLEIYNQLQIWFDTYEDDINQAMIDNGHLPVKRYLLILLSNNPNLVNMASRNTSRIRLDYSTDFVSNAYKVVDANFIEQLK